METEITIIFIDNLERLGKDSWEILKAIIKIFQLKNILFILPMHINKMHNNIPVDKSEFPIEKYLDIKMFNFNQDYRNLFCNMNFSNNFINDLIIIFKSEISGQILTIREIERRLRSNGLPNKKYSKYQTYSIIYNNIWGEKTIFFEIISPIVKESYDLLIKQKKLIENIPSLYTPIIGYRGYPIEIFSEETEFLYSFQNWNYQENYLNLLINRIKNAKTIENNFSVDCQTKNIEKTKVKNKQDKWEKTLLKVTNEKSELQKKWTDENNKDPSEKDSSVMVNFEKEMDIKTDGITESNQKIDVLNQEIDVLNQEIDVLNQEIDVLKMKKEHSSSLKKELKKQKNNFKELTDEWNKKIPNDIKIIIKNSYKSSASQNHEKEITETIECLLKIV